MTDLTDVRRRVERYRRSAFPLTTSQRDAIALDDALTARGADRLLHVVEATEAFQEESAALRKLLAAQDAELKAARAYIRPLNPKPGDEQAYRAWCDAAAHSNTVAAQVRHILEVPA